MSETMTLALYGLGAVAVVGIGYLIYRKVQESQTAQAPQLPSGSSAGTQQQQAAADAAAAAKAAADAAAAAAAAAKAAADAAPKMYTAATNVMAMANLAQGTKQTGRYDWDPDNPYA